jgi:beta-lactamase superfamily II metal-dependent hydrolase
MFAIEMLPAQQGDALVLEYGDEAKTRRVLIDGGTYASANALRARIESLPVKQRVFELLIVSHIDTDHIGGIIKLFSNPPDGLRFRDVWFNAWRHLPTVTDESLGPIDGEILNILLGQPRVGNRPQRWNHAFAEGPVVVGPKGPLPHRTLPGGLELTLLSPTDADLRVLRREWAKVIRDAKLTEQQVREIVVARADRKGIDLPLGSEVSAVRAAATSRFKSDTSPANASSIAVLAEYDGRSIVLGADAYAPVLTASVERLLASRDRQRLRLSALKLPHHGSRANVSNPLLKLLETKRFLFSTSGAMFDHPDLEAVGRVLASGGKNCELIFNYATESTVTWKKAALKRAFGYSAEYPSADTAGIRVEL